MKILITGGSGFIGHNVAIRLQDKHEVIIYDNYTDYGIIDRDDMDALHFERWKLLTCKRVNGDMRSRAKLASVFGGGIDTVITWLQHLGRRSSTIIRSLALK